MLDNYTTSPANKQAENRQAALHAAAHGLRVFPVRVARKKGQPHKKAATILVDSWKAEATTDTDQIKAWWDRYPDAVPGMPTGEFFVVDLDEGEGKNGTAEFKAMGLDPEDALFAVRTPTGGQHLYYNGAEGLTISKGDLAPGIDTRGEGGFVFAPGACTIFGEYRVERGDLFDLEHGLLTDLPGAIRAALEKPEREPVQTEPGEYDLATIKDALHTLPNDGDYDDWTETLMALHHATGGSHEGLVVALGWSAGYPGFDPKEVRAKWRSFGKHKGAPITADTLFMKARQHGWDERAYDDLLDDLDDESETGGADLDDDILALLGPEPEPAKSFDYDGLTFATPAECATGDPRPYVVKGLLAERDVACIVGAPGVGKSLLAPRLAYAVAQGEPVFDRRVKQAGVFYVAAEDEHGMKGRVRALREELGEAPNLHVVGGISDLLTTEPVKVKGKPRQRCKQADTLVKAVRDHKPGLVVIDTLAMAFPGLEENSAEGMGRVVALARRLTKWGAAVLLIHHDTKDGQQGLPRGHSLLNGALDVSIHLRQGDSGIVTGKLTKNRNGSCDVDLAFRIRADEIGTDADGDPVTLAVCDPCDPRGADMRPKLTPRQSAALETLREAGGGDWVTREEWREAAADHPDFLAIERPDTRRRAFDRSVKDLIERKTIEADGRDNGVFRPFDEYREILDDL